MKLFWLDLSLDFKHSLLAFFGLLKNPLASRFLALLSLGQYGTYAADLQRNFMDLGLLHILVLSGSQISSFIRVTQWFTADRFHGFSLRLVTVLMSLSLLILGTATQWPAPLARAIFSALLLLWFPRLLPVLAISLTLILQLTLFPSHALKVGFYLSWICWLSLRLSRHFIPHPLSRAIVLTTACQIWALCFCELPLPPLQNFLVWIVSGCFWGIIFDVWVFPMIGILYLLALLGCGMKPIFHVNLMEEAMPAMALFLNALSKGILVALHSFMYTFRYDLQ